MGRLIHPDHSRDSEFTLELGHYSIRKDHPASAVTKKTSSIAECYRNCISNKDIPCLAFSFCSSTAHDACVLSSLNINGGDHRDPGQDNATVFKSECNIYSGIVHNHSYYFYPDLC